MSKHVFVIAALAFSFVVPGARAQAPKEHVLIETNAARYEGDIGSILAAGADLMLDGGEFVVLIAESGETIRVDGPYSGAPPSEERRGIDLLQAVARLIGGSPERLAGPGGFRNIDDEDATPDLRPSPWLIHAERSGQQCFVRGRSTELWRSNPESTLAVEIHDVVSGDEAVIEWAADSNSTLWPDALPPANGAIYTIRQTGRVRSDSTIQVFSLEPGVADDALTAAAWLAARGCTEQARLALESAG